MPLEATRTAQDATTAPEESTLAKCPDCGNQRPIYRVGCPGCLADLIRDQPREDWDYALSNVSTTFGHKISFQTKRRLGMR